MLHVASNSISCQRQVAIIFGPRQIEQSKCKSDNWRRAFSAANFATKLSATLPLHCCSPCFCCSSDAEGRSCSKREARMSDGDALQKTGDTFIHSRYKFYHKMIYLAIVARCRYPLYEDIQRTTNLESFRIDEVDFTKLGYLIFFSAYWGLRI